MRTCLLSALLILAGTIHSIAQDAPPAPPELLSAQKTYQAELDKIEEKHMGIQAEAVSDYEKQLTTLEDKLTSKGDLDGVVAVQKEKARFKASHDLQIPEKSIAKSPAELNALQMKLKVIPGQLKQSKDAETAKAATTYVDKLETMKTDLTKAKKIREALMVKTEIEKTKQGINAASSDSSDIPDIRASIETLAEEPKIALLAELFKKVNSISNDETKVNIETFVTIGVLKLNKNDIYLKNIAPLLRDRALVEKTVFEKCSACENGTKYTPCVKCGGNGKCTFCKGSGRTSEGWGCPVCFHANGQCTPCKSTGRTEAVCQICNGSGLALSQAKLNRLYPQYIDLLRKAFGTSEEASKDKADNLSHK